MSRRSLTSRTSGCVRVRKSRLVSRPDIRKSVVVTVYRTDGLSGFPFTNHRLFTRHAVGVQKSAVALIDDTYIKHTCEQRTCHREAHRVAAEGQNPDGVVFSHRAGRQFVVNPD